MPRDPHECAIELVRRSHDWASAYAAQEYGRFRAGLHAQGVLEYLRTLMWREYMLGVHVPAKAMTLLPEDAQDLKLLLARQIHDEWKHSRILAERVRAFRGDDDLMLFVPSESDWKLYHDTYDWPHPVELVTSLNCTGEVMITEMFKVIRDEILADEPGGAPSLVDPDLQRRALRVQDTKMATLRLSHEGLVTRVLAAH